ncbi:MAG: putative transport system ATP-binding protein [Actinomycetota bacterium]|jgi:putative ABC transport system ATP-binding protein
MRVGVSDLTVEYSSGGYLVRPIDSLDFEVETGQLVLLLGPSGCGKTTLLSCLAGILSPTSGTIVAGETEVTALRGKQLSEYRRSTVGIVFQAFNLIPSLSALENVAAPLRVSGRTSVAHARAHELLERVGLTERVRHRPGQLSGGQQQRVAIARALAHDPPVILADEPTAHLDYVQVESVLQLIRELAAPGRVVIVATHDDRLTPLADHIVELGARPVMVETSPRRVELEPGQILFRQGDDSDLVYVVEAGEIEIFRVRADGSEELVNRIGPPGYFGELGPLLGTPRSASARAWNFTVLTGYSTADFQRLDKTAL